MCLEELEAIARGELAKHGLSGWTFGWSQAKRRLGVCKYRLKRIEIAEFYARNNPSEKVLDTLLHEIAHALAGPAAKHGPAWKAVAMRIGATPLACDSSPETIVIPGDWQANCPACRRTYHRYKRPARLTGYRCRCAARAPLTFQYAGVPVQPFVVSMRLQDTAKWEAHCAGCRTVHLRVRKPKAGVWRCSCPHRCELLWQMRSAE